MSADAVTTGEPRLCRPPMFAEGVEMRARYAPGRFRGFDTVVRNALPCRAQCIKMHPRITPPIRFRSGDGQGAAVRRTARNSNGAPSN